jgi:hypothetical protein
MRISIKNILLKIIPEFLIKRRSQSIIISNWKKNNYPSPPPHIIKQLTIVEYQKKFGIQTLIETGTYLGDMVEAQKARFKKIVSIELGVDLYEKATQRFKNDKNVLIVQGDSGKVLSTVMKDINAPAIFWLDGHYSAGLTAKGDKDCPIFEELDSIFLDKKLNHILLIDDARLFVGKGDYPTTKKLTEYVKRINPEYQEEIKYDIIRYSIPN